jgi:hypothetical protein
MGRHSKFNQKTADYICEQLSNGRSLRAILQEDEELPALRTIFRWLDDFPEFCHQYARAREASCEHMANDLIEIADEPVGTTNQGSTDSGAVQKQRLQIDTRKWLLSKLAPKKYGEKIEHDHSGAVTINQITRRVIDPLTIEQKLTERAANAVDVDTGID